VFELFKLKSDVLFAEFFTLNLLVYALSTDFERI
jgi:hypothetical protein